MNYNSPKVLVFPEDKNPYQELLYKELEKRGVQYSYVNFKTSSHTVRFIELFYLLAAYRSKGFNIFHLHWLYSFKLPSNFLIFNNIFTRLVFTIYVIIWLSYIKILGYKVVWTMHNIEPHEKRFVDELWMTKFIVSLSDQTIVHTKETINLLKIKKIKTTNVKVIPLGTYTYLNSKFKKTEARKQLNLPKDTFIFLHFGVIRPHKGVPVLIRTFLKLFKNDDSHSLIIIGKSIEESLKEKIIKLCSGSTNIITILDFVDNTTLATYIRASDVVVLPYKKVTTSSTAYAALGSNVPVICPNIGDFKEISEEVSFKYKNDLSSALQTAVERIDTVDFTKFNKLLSESSWENISKQTQKLYLDIL